MKPVLLAIALTACVTEPALEVSTSSHELVDEVTRTHIRGDVYHHTYVVRVGDGPNAELAIHRVVRERAPWIPRSTTDGIMLMHGDFARFPTNFAPAGGGMAAYLAERGIDVWGFDRRWTRAPEGEADVSDFDAMGIDQEIDDVGIALAFARGVRLLSGSGAGRMVLSGFSRGGQLAYYYASREANRPLRHVKGLVPLDVYVTPPPADEDIRQYFCDLAASEYATLDAGITDGPNDFIITSGRRALADPNGPSQFPGFKPTNRDMTLWIAGQTYEIFTPNPNYHLAGPTRDETGTPTGLRFSPETAIWQWFADAAPHQSIREQADSDAITCGDAPPVDVPLSRIRVPLLLIAAAGGYGDRAVFSTTQVSSTDVSTLVIRRLAPEQELEDFGHGDLLFASDAPALAWDPLLAWLRTH
ncbi:MAG: hypothetical protein ACKV2T_10870 [Kofleriaceae bacterium]